MTGNEKNLWLMWMLSGGKRLFAYCLDTFIVFLLSVLYSGYYSLCLFHQLVLKSLKSLSINWILNTSHFAR